MSESRSPRSVDVVLDAPASLSIYLQALLDAGRRGEATVVVDAHEHATMAAAMNLSATGGWTATKENGVPMPHRYDMTRLDIRQDVHAPPRDASLHSHLVTGARVEVDELRRCLPAAQACYHRALGDKLADELGLHLSYSHRTPQVEGVPVRLVKVFEAAPCRIRTDTAQMRPSLQYTASVLR